MWPPYQVKWDCKTLVWSKFLPTQATEFTMFILQEQGMHLTAYIMTAGLHRRQKGKSIFVSRVIFFYVECHCMLSSKTQSHKLHSKSTNRVILFIFFFSSLNIIYVFRSSNSYNIFHQKMSVCVLCLAFLFVCIPKLPTSLLSHKSKITLNLLYGIICMYMLGTYNIKTRNPVQI